MRSRLYGAIAIAAMIATPAMVGRSIDPERVVE
jgi:hypothetical protein